MEAVLVLNADYTLLEIVSWQKAVNLFFRGKVRIVEQYAGRFLRSPSVTIKFPAVVARIKYVKPRKRVRFSRKNILCRDYYSCQYCGVKPRNKAGAPHLEDLTIDHVVARSKAINGWVILPWNKKRVRVTSWENTLTACAPCNSRKADLTLKQAGMTMLKKPKAPSVYDLAYMSLFKYNIPTEWKDYLPEGSPWRDYWTAELTD